MNACIIAASGIVSALGNDGKQILDDMLTYKTAIRPNKAALYFSTIHEEWLYSMHAPIEQLSADDLCLEDRLKFLLKTMDTEIAANTRLLISEYLMYCTNLMFFHCQKEVIAHSNYFKAITNVHTSSSDVATFQQAMHCVQHMPSTTVIFSGLDCLVATKSSSINHCSLDKINGEGAAYIICQHKNNLTSASCNFRNIVCIPPEAIMLHDIILTDDCNRHYCYPQYTINAKIIAINKYLGHTGHAVLPILLALAHQSNLKVCIIYQELILSITSLT